MKKWTTLLIFILPAIMLHSQSANPPAGALYDDTQVSRMDLLMPPDSLAWLLDDANRWSNLHIHAQLIHTHVEGVDTVDNVGVRLRGNTSRSAAKKSWKISFNTFVAGRKHFGVEKINLNGQHNDPSISRAKICSDLLSSMGLPSMRANHIELYINGQYMGVYLNNEHIDEQYVDSRFGNNDGHLFKCTYPADLHYLGDDPSEYDFDQFKPPYELVSYTGDRDYSELVHFIDVLNNVQPIEDLPCALEPLFNVDQYLKFIVFDILTGNWDGPIFNKNNFYLYQNTATGKFEYMAFDLDNTFGIDWFNIDWAGRDIYQWSKQSDDRPIYQRILGVPEYRDRFSYYMKQVLTSVYTAEQINSHLEKLRDLISPYVADDDFYTYTYGFEYLDFLKSFDSDVDWNHVPISIKDYADRRRSTALQQLDIRDIAPIIRAELPLISHTVGTVSLSANIEDDGSIIDAILYYKDMEANDYSSMAMQQSGSQYEAVISFLEEDISTLQYYIEVSDDAGHVSRAPRCGTTDIRLSNSTLTLAINELLASNTESNVDEAGEYDDWLELYNYGNTAISLGGISLTDQEENTSKWQLPELTLEAGTYLLIWMDKDEEQGPLHADIKLSSGGEYVGIYDTASAYVDGLSFPEQSADISYGRIPNGNGEFQFMTPSPSSSNNPLSIDNESMAEISIFPNPASEQLVVQYSNRSAEASLQIVDLHGTTLRQAKIRAGANAVNLKELPAGAYLITIISDGAQIYSRQIVKL